MDYLLGADVRYFSVSEKQRDAFFFRIDRYRRLSAATSER